MTIITRMRKQKAVWWQQDGRDRFNELFYKSGEIIDCRWDDSITEFLDAEGKRVLSQAVVYVDRELKVGDVLFLDDEVPLLPDHTTPPSYSGAYRIRQFKKIPNLRNTETLLIAYL